MKLMGRRIALNALCGIFAVGLTLGTIGIVSAHKGATGVVMERMMAMKSMGDGMKSISNMVRGKSPMDAGKLKQSAVAIKKHALDIPKMFPEGSIKGPSEAIPAIWKNWSEFEEHAKKLAEFAGKVEALTSSDPADIKPLFVGMSKTCTGCHQDFRKKKE